MIIPSILRFYMLLALTLLLALLPLFKVNAQETKEKPEKMRIRMSRTFDGKTEVIDTTFSVAELRDLAVIIKELKLDTAALGALNNLEFSMQHADSLLQRMLPDKIEVWEEGDSARFRHIKRGNLHHVDSLKVRRLGRAENLYRRPGGPAEVEHIMIERHRGPGRGDSVWVRNIENRFKVITDEKTGEKKVYRIDKDGKEEELRGEALQHRGVPGRTIIFVHKANVQDMTREDKQALKDAGAPVETKPKEELKVEEITFYPNPNNGRFTLNFSLDKKATTVVRIMDSKGNEVFVDTVEKLSGQYNREIDLRVFGPGIYYLQVAQGKRYHTRKLLVQ